MCKCIGVWGLPKPPVTVGICSIHFCEGTPEKPSLPTGCPVFRQDLKYPVPPSNWWCGVAEWLTIRLEPVGGWRYKINTGLNSYKWPTKKWVTGGYNLCRYIYIYNTCKCAIDPMGNVSKQPLSFLPSCRSQTWLQASAVVSLALLGPAWTLVKALRTAQAL